MKKLTAILLISALICLLAIPAAATTELSIVRQPQNPTVIEYGFVEYEIKAYGYNLYCTWYMEYEGKTYDISDTSVGIQPWEPYAGETYGDLDPEVNGAFTTFRYFFRGIGPELDGAKIYAVITDGQKEITSQKARIRVVEDAGTPPVIMVTSGMEVYQDEPLELYCEASDPMGGTLSYLWYETATGELEDIIAVNRGSEDKDTLRVDTSTPGTYYYVCGVDTSNGGSAYSSVIPVTVFYKQKEIPVQYTEDTRSLVGYTITVDIMAMMDQDARIWNAVLENRVQYQWYQDGQAIDGATSKALKLEDTHDGKVVHVVVTCDDLVMRGTGFEITREAPPFGIGTEVLPDGTVGESYTAQLEANNPDAFFEDWAVGTEGTTLSSIGLSLSTDGKITGTPTKAGDFDITIHASCAEGEDQRTFKLTIAPAKTDDPAQPTDPTQPSEPAQPTDPTQPSEPAGPTQPSEPAEPTQPAQKDDPADQPKAEFPGWGYVIIAVVALGIVAAVVLFAIKKKKN